MLNGKYDIQNIPYFCVSGKTYHQNVKHFRILSKPIHHCPLFPACLRPTYMSYLSQNVKSQTAKYLRIMIDHLDTYIEL